MDSPDASTKDDHAETSISRPVEYMDHARSKPVSSITGAASIALLEFELLNTRLQYAEQNSSFY
jgi:hypothetical protein